MAGRITQTSQTPEGTGDVGEADTQSTKLSLIVGENLRALRRKSGLSLERLSHLSGVSRAMLGQIETGKSAPTINLLGRIAQALGVSVPHLISNQEATGTIILPRDRTAVVASSDGAFTARAIFPWGEPQRAEIFELALAAGHREFPTVHAPGVKKTLIVTEGVMEVTIGEDSSVHLSEGDAILFSADIEHNLHNPGTLQAKAFLVIAYLEMPHPRPSAL